MQQITIEIPELVYGKLSDVSDATGMTLEDLIAAASDMVYSTPTQSVIKRVLRRAHAFKVERVLASFPKSNKIPNSEGS